ncbi:hypothetical protein acdb102_23050 [Acidothermaceae bacterium B102]|nr:hypothetical protein acdb102_23050 [Acidothermaceae bacterium B102]
MATTDMRNLRGAGLLTDECDDPKPRGSTAGVRDAWSIDWVKPFSERQPLAGDADFLEGPSSIVITIRKKSLQAGKVSREPDSKSDQPVGAIALAADPEGSDQEEHALKFAN